MQNITCMKHVHHRPTQSIMYLHCPIARFQEFVLLNVQYKHKKSCFQHKIMLYWFYYSTRLTTEFTPDQNGRAEMFCTSYVPAPNGQICGSGP